MRRLNGSIALVSALFGLAVSGCGSDAESPRDFDRTGGSGTGSNVAVPGAGTAAYPSAPFGTTPGSVVENFAFLGWKSPEAANYEEDAFERVSLSDFYDPDGAKGIKLIVLNGSAVWCGVCQGEARDIKSRAMYARYKALGVEFVWSLFEDASGNPAKPLDLANWASVYQVDFPMVLDPSLKLGAFFSADATPLNLVIDARTMRIVDVMLGYNPTSHWAALDYHLDQL